MEKTIACLVNKKFVTTSADVPFTPANLNEVTGDLTRFLHLGSFQTALVGSNGEGGILTFSKSTRRMLNKKIV